MNPTILMSRALCIIAAVTMIANLVTGAFAQHVLLTVFPVGHSSTIWFERAFWGAGIGLAVGFFLVETSKIRTSHDPLVAISYCAVLLVAVSCAGITGSFSSRYVVLAIPFLVIVSNAWKSRVEWQIAGACVGFVLGLHSLVGYGLWKQ